MPYFPKAPKSDITYPMFFFSICKNPFYGPTAHIVKLSTPGSMSNIFCHFYYFLNINKYSCAISKKLYFILWFLQYPVELQLCCSFITISFNLKPVRKNVSITLKPIGIM